jgi:hypothetical protein
MHLSGLIPRVPGKLAACIPGFLLLFHAGAADLYVATGGDNSNPGTKSKPFASLERARDEARKLRMGGQPPEGGITIWLQGGDYLRTNSLTLAAIDSGTPGSPLVWRSMEGETVRLLGGRTISAWAPVKDEQVLRRLPTNARTVVVQADLRALGIVDFGGMKSRGFGRATTPAHCELFFDGRPMSLARWPNEGSWELIESFPEARAENDGHGGKIGKLEEGFNYRGDRPRRWQNKTDVWVHGYWSWDWANSYEQVESIDFEKRLLKTKAPHGLYGFRKGQRYHFLNVLEELDQAGEWFLDRSSGMLYFWPPDPIVTPGEKSGKAPKETVVSLLAQPLIRLDGISNCTLQGLTFEAARGNAVEIHGGSSNRVAGCRIRNIGDWGVTIRGGTSHGVLSCDITDTGDGGVSLQGGDRQTLSPSGHFVENCHFVRQGRWSKCYVPAVLMDGVGTRVANNLIHDHPHCAILFNGNDHVIELNEIHHIALETGDVGAIYTGRDYTYRGNRIRHNFIHHTGGVGMGSMGVYMDDCVSGTEIFGNIFYGVQRAAFLGGGRDHQVINNIFVDCDHAVELDGRGLDSAPVWRGMVNETMRKRLAEVPLSLYRERYPAMKSLDRYYGPPEGPAIESSAFKGVLPEDNVVARNVSVGKWLKVYWHAKPEMLRLENNLTNALNSFVATPRGQEVGDFALSAGSPAWALGFQEIPLKKIGLISDRLRRNLATANVSGTGP